MSFARSSVGGKQTAQRPRTEEQNDTQKKRRGRSYHSTPPTTTHDRGDVRPCLRTYGAGPRWQGCLIAVAGHQRQRCPSFASIQLSERKDRNHEIDWLATLAEQGDIAKSKATEVATLVVKPELPLEIASRLYRNVEKGAQSFDRILSDIEDADVSDELLEAADALAELWSQLSVASANKLRELQGLPPITMSEAPH